MPSTDPTAKAALPLRTVLRLCLWAAVVGLAFGLFLGREVLLAG